MRSQVKEDRFREEKEALEKERARIEEERIFLMKEKNHESVEWKNKFERMRDEHEEVVENLKEANKCYLVQVNENEELREQLSLMQNQHEAMMKRFEDIEQRISSSTKSNDRAITEDKKREEEIKFAKEESLA